MYELAAGLDKETIEMIQVRSKGIPKIMDELNLYLKSLTRENDGLRKRLQTFNKEEEIQKLQNELDRMRLYSLHIMSEKEHEDARTFSKYHYETCNSNIQYILEGTGIGTGIVVVCKKCKTEKDITDVSGW